MNGQSGISPEVLPLPKGGGAVRSIGESFEPDLHTGTGNYPVPLWFPAGPGKLRPELTLVYSTGAGNGPYGMGWTLGAMAVSRQTERGLPTYDDSRDTFLLSGAELVELADGSYRAHQESGFFRVQRDGDGWQVDDRGGRRFVLGDTAESRFEDPEGQQGDGQRIAAWQLARVVDPSGNEIRFGYRRDRGQVYLESIRYAPYTVSFHYQSRPDVLTDRRLGFEVTTALRLTAITYQLDGDAVPFRRYELTYDECPHSRLSLLSRVTFSGEQDGESADLPALDFTYNEFSPSRSYRAFRSEVDAPPALGLGDDDYDLIDLYGDGLPGVIELGHAIKRFWPNRGEGRWGAPETLRELPASVALANPAVAFADLDGNGTADLLTLGERPLGYYRNQPGEGWTEAARFRKAPQFDPRDGELRLLDLDGDGLVDVLRSSGNAFYAYYNRGEEGWQRPVKVPRLADSRRFPNVRLADPRVFLADMTGDGLIDIVTVHDGRLDYWPHFGRARFGERVTLALAPAIGRRFDPARLFLSDVNGDGLSDVIYVERDHVRVWINRGGRALHSLPAIRHTPRTDAGSVQLADMYGTGTAGLLWSFARSRRDPHNYKYLDFTGGTRPYLLATIDNGVGLRTEISYEPSTAHALAAAADGRPWQTTLPFPVPTVAEITRRDLVTGVATSKRMRYFDGYFDGRERAFRGFGRVEVVEVGDADTPSALNVSYFHQGVRGTTPGDTAEQRNALTGRLYRLEVYDAEDLSQPFRREDSVYAVRQLDTGRDGREVWFPHLTSSTVEVFDQQADPLVNTTELTYDDFGNVTEKRESWDRGNGQESRVTSLRYSADSTRWLLNLPVEELQRDDSGEILKLERFYYDGDPFVGLPLGQVTRGELRRHEQMVITDAEVTRVYGADAPDYAALGYHRLTFNPSETSDGEQGWAIDAVGYRHDARGNPIRRRDARGGETAITYDADGLFPIEIRNPLGQISRVTYDRRAGRLSRIDEPNGHATSYRYDAVGRLTAMIKPGDSAALPTVELNHLDDSLPVAVRTRVRERSGDVDTIDQIEYFNGARDVIQKRSSAENGQVLVDGWKRFNVRGWEAERTSPFLSNGFAYVAGEGQGSVQRYRFEHDAMGRVVTAITPDGRPSRTVYAAGTITRYDVSDTDDSAANVARGHFDTPRREIFDAQGNLLEVREENSGAAARTTRYEYDARSRLIRTIDARGITTSRLSYDLLGRKIEVVHVDAGRRRIAHDAAGAPILTLDPRGQRTTIRNDVLGRKSEVRIDGTVAERYTYDAGTGANLIGRLARVEDEAGTVELSYTDRGHIASKTRVVPTSGGQRALGVQYAYDSMERMTEITYPDNSTARYRYNGRGVLDRVDGLVDGITYDALGRIERVDYANGVSDHAAFDPQTFFLSEARVEGPARSQPYYQMSYTYDTVGNPLTITDGVAAVGHTVFQRQLTYDALYQLTSASGTVDGTPFSHQYSYDDAGNFLHNDAFGAQDLTLVPGTNRLRGVQSGGSETVLFDHDAAGNLVRMPDKTLQYDARSRLVRVEKTDGTVVEYTYGFEGERVRKRVTVGATTTETVYLDNLYEESGGREKRHVFNGKTRLATFEGAATFIYHRDHIGNTVLVTDAAGDIVQELGYFPYGTLAFSTGTDFAEHRFLGDVFDDEVGLVYALSRYYDPALGRFITPDLFSVLNPEEVLSLPLHLNPYVYAGNNPLRWVDDEGAWWKWLVGALVIAALVVATVVVGVFTGGAGFAFGILLAASIGSAFGAGVGVYSAATSGGDLADGFLFGALVGGAAGALGYAAGVGVGAAGISGVWGSILAGAAQGAVIGAANGAIAGYAGGAGSIEDILIQAGIGFVVGAVVGGAMGYLSHSQPQVGGTTEKGLGTGTHKGYDALGGPIEQNYETGLGSVGKTLGKAWEPATQSVINSLATPVGFNVGVSVATGVAGFGHAAAYHDWDDIRAWILELTGEDEIIINEPDFPPP